MPNFRHQKIFFQKFFIIFAENIFAMSNEVKLLPQGINDFGRIFDTEVLEFEAAYCAVGEEVDAFDEYRLSIYYCYIYIIKKICRMVRMNLP